MTIEQANAYFASLPEGFAPARQLQEALSAKAGRVDYLGVAGTAGKRLPRPHGGGAQGLPASLPAATTQAVSRSLPASG